MKAEADKKANPLAFYRPLPAAEKFHCSTARKRLNTGGNRSSKSTSGIAETLMWLSGVSRYRNIPKGPLQGVVSGLSFGLMELNMLPIFQNLIPKVGFNLVWQTNTKYIEGPNGKAWFKSNEQGWESYQGVALDFFYLDEEHDLSVFRQLTKRLKAGSRIQSWYTMTAEPDRSDHWTYDELYLPAQEGKQEEFAHFEFDLNDNRVSRGGYIDDSEIDALIAQTPEEHRPAVIHGKYVKRGGLVYPDWSKNTHMSVERPLSDFLDAVKSNLLTAFCSLDWGVRNSTSVGLWVEDKDGKVQRIDEIYRPARDVLDIKREVHKRFAAFRPQFYVADPSIWNNHDTTDEAKTIGGQFERDDYDEKLPGLPIIKGDNDEINGQAACRELLRVHPTLGPLLTVQPRCRDFIREIENYVHEEWVSRSWERNKKEVARKQNNHAMDEFKYFALSPHRYLPPRRKQVQSSIRVSPVTGYVRPRATV